MSKDLSRLHAISRGRVQGVGFRWFILAKARALGLSGQVWNRSDGSVEVSAEGPKADLEQLVKAVQEGPDSSQVDGTTIEWEDYAGNYTAFEIAPTR